MTPTLVCVFLFLAVVFAQAPPDVPCQAGVSDCCITTLEDVVVDGIHYLHQICSNRAFPACSPGCGCAGLCADSTAYCTCVSPSTSPSTSPTAMGTPLSTPSQTPTSSYTAYPTPSHTRTRSAQATQTPSRSLGASPPPTRSSTPSVTPSATRSNYTRSAHPSPSAPVTPPPRSNRSIGPPLVAIIVSVVALCCGMCLCLAAALFCRRFKLRRVKRTEPVDDPDSDADNIALRERTDKQE